MDKIDWEIIELLGRENSMVKVAQKLFISQPAVAYRLNKMENEFSKTLFSRTSKGISFTSAGLRLYSFSKSMIQHSDDVFQSVTGEDDQLYGSITVGVTAPFLEDNLCYQIKSFNEQYPNIKIHIATHSSTKLFELLNSGELLLSITRGIKNFSGNSIEIFSEKTLIISNEPITNESLKTKPYISPMTHISNISDIWVAKNFKDGPPVLSNISLQGTSRSLLSLVSAGLGWSIIPESRYSETLNLYKQYIYDEREHPHISNYFVSYSNKIQEFDTYRAYLDHLTTFLKKK